MSVAPRRRSILLATAAVTAAATSPALAAPVGDRHPHRPSGPLVIGHR
ncbi:glycerophosphodiester phosphodiesterase, partial [Streptomyces sp. SID4931]